MDREELADRLDDAARGLHPYSLGELASPSLDAALPAYLRAAAQALRRQPSVEEVARVIAKAEGNHDGEWPEYLEAARQIASLYGGEGG